MRYPRIAGIRKHVLSEYAVEGYETALECESGSGVMQVSDQTRGMLPPVAFHPLYEITLSALCYGIKRRVRRQAAAGDLSSIHRIDMHEAAFAEPHRLVVLVPNTKTDYDRAVVQSLEVQPPVDSGSLKRSVHGESLPRSVRLFYLLN